LSLSRITRFYAHDDRFGPYARLHYGIERNAKGIETRVLQLDPTEPGYEDLCVKMHFSHALVPFYPKLRLTAEELTEFAVEVLPLVRKLVAVDLRPTIVMDARFELSGAYLRRTMSYDTDPRRIRQLCCNAVLSRYVGVVSFFVGDDEWYCDFVYDTTDLRRSRNGTVPSPLLAILAKDGGLVGEFKASRKWLGDQALVV